MSDITTVYVILGAAVVLFVSNRVAVELVAIGVSLSLLATGLLDTDQALAGFGDPTVIFIASLFVVSEGLDGTGVTTWAGQRLMTSVGTSRTRLIVMMMLLVALLTALISVNGAVAALIPVIVVIAMRLGRAPSQLLMPLAFAAHAGVDAGAHRDAREHHRLRGGVRRQRRRVRASSRSRSSAFHC